VRAVLDPNVLVSAAISGRGVSAEIVRRWEGGEFELVVSAEILFELSEVLRRPRFRRYLTEAEALDYVLRLHDGAAEVSEELPKDVVRGVTRDPGETTTSPASPTRDVPTSSSPVTRISLTYPTGPSRTPWAGCWRASSPLASSWSSYAR
jgi:predicted nucleic acid-binding protein